MIRVVPVTIVLTSGKVLLTNNLGEPSASLTIALLTAAVLKLLLLGVAENTIVLAEWLILAV